MPRRARLILPHTPLHIIQRGNNRDACFFADEDYRHYLDWLKEYADDEDSEVHAYVLMTNHVHLLMSAGTSTGPGRLMKRLGQRYVQYMVNRGESGTDHGYGSVADCAIACGRPYLALPRNTAKQRSTSSIKSESIRPKDCPTLLR